MPVIITDKDKPKVTPDTLLVNDTNVVPPNGYSYGFGQNGGTKVPQNIQGLYYSNDKSWANIVTQISNAVYNAIYNTIVQLIIQSAPVVVQSISKDLVVGENIVPHTLGLKPNIIQFWQGDDLWVGGFVTSRTNTNIVINSTDDYSGIEIDLIAFK